MITTNNTLPEPFNEAKHHSNRLIETIRQLIVANKSKITFAEFMQQALYAPGLGYYTSGTRKFGADGDFVTAPEISPLFSYCIAEQCREVLKKLSSPYILEFGAGTGKMALNILQHLKRCDQLPEKYSILEVSADLQQRQQELFQQQAPDLLDRVQWLTALPEQAFSGVILANEVIDAMPVHIIEFNQNNIEECYVGWDEQFIWKRAPICDLSVTQQAKNLQPFINTDANAYHTEVRPIVKPWLSSLNEILTEGLVLLIDYGFPQKEFYHPDRSQGTLMCHYQHRAHANPFLWPGLQDITTHVDFSHLAQEASQLGFHIAGYTTQAFFLMACGLLDFVTKINGTEQQWQANQQIKQLTLPSEMGELFKVLALTKNLNINLRGFSMRDMRERL